MLYLEGRIVVVLKMTMYLCCRLTDPSSLALTTDYLCLLECKSSPSQVSNALLTTALILGLHYHFSGKISTLIVFLRAFRHILDRGNHASIRGVIG